MINYWITAGLFFIGSILISFTPNDNFQIVLAILLGSLMISFAILDKKR